MARFSRIRKAQFRCGAAEERWREFVNLLRESAPVSGYAGPELQMVERVQADIVPTRTAIANWRAKAEGKRSKVAAPAEGHRAAQKLMQSRRAKATMAEVERIFKMAGC